ncbi:MAG: copper-translocating P-type ATPase [Rhodocyclales bacterium]|nr:MAG: copper-translocating P-type ATPase [Rhodocyclales bacterium]GIK24110.1 MAG: copper-translocating P-type ATPase [Betaproteobacteria bacterium]
MKHCVVVHRLRRRIRLVAPSLLRQTERGYLLEILLRKHAAVKDVRVVVDIGSLTVHYDPAQLPEERLLAVVDAVIGNLAEAPPPKPAAAAQAPDGPQVECSVAVEGMTCASCALLIEMHLKRDPQVANASVNFAAGTATVQGNLDREALSAHVARLGYVPRPMDTLAQRRLLVERERMRLVESKRRFLQAAWLTAPVMVTGMLMHRSPTLRLVELALSTVVVFGTGGDIFRKAWMLAKQREANMDTLIALGAGAAWIYSLPGIFRRYHHVYFESAAGIVTFVLLGRFLEERAKGKASEAIRKLIELQPDTAVRLRRGVEEIVPIDEVQIGDLLRVRPGDRVPIDGVVEDGRSAVDESLVTGESLPVAKAPGDAVIGGCINGTGSFTLRATAVNGETVLSGIVRMVDHAQSAKLPVQKLADRISARFVPAVGAVAGLTFAGWLLAGHPAARALSHAVAVLLIACPCALGLATPTAIMVGTGQAARRGIYIRNGEALETSSKLTTLVFDKTGTITEGKPVVTDFLAAESEDEAALATFIASAEAPSEHFLGQALAAWARERGAKVRAAKDFNARPGRGVQAFVSGKTIRIGNAALLEEAGIDTGNFAAQAEAWAGEGKTPVFVAIGQRCAAILAVADRPREGAKEAIALLHRLGLTTVMATGDLEATAQYIARQVGIDQVVARATPADKLELVRRLQAEGPNGKRRVGMVGDGINDAPALAAADVGFAIGSGADIALESADITLVGGDITRVAAGIELSRRTMSVIRQNLFWALGYNTVAIPVAAAGRLNPMIASAAMAMSSVSVLSNSLRLQQNK